MVHNPSPSNSEKPLHFLASLSSALNCELLENRDPVLLVFVSSKGLAWNYTSYNWRSEKARELLPIFMESSKCIYPEANKK